jgi:hypothetical protein
MSFNCFYVRVRDPVRSAVELSTRNELKKGSEVSL